MHRISSGLRHIIWVRANFNLLRPRHVFFTHVSIRKETYHRQVNQLKDYTFIAIHYCVVDMKAPDGDVDSLYHTQIWVICLRGGGVDNIEAILSCPTSWWCLLEWWAQSSSSSGKPGAGGKRSCPDLGQMCGNSVELKSFLRLLHTHVALILAYDPSPTVLGRPSNRSHFDATRTVTEEYRTSPKGQNHSSFNLDLSRRQHGLHSEENSKVFSLRVPLLICTTT